MLHKHIARHTKRYVTHFTKYLYERDTLFATISVFIFLILLGMIPLNLYVLNPMKMALKDFDFNDIAYAKAHKDERIKKDDRVVIVNTGYLDRAELGFLIETVNAYQPKVIGLDIFFEGEREPEKDSILREAFKKTKNLVAVSVAESDGHHVTIRKNHFDSVLPKRGYANLVGEDVGTIRYYVPFDQINGKKYPQITSAIVKEYNETAYNKLEKRHKEVETINYTRTIDNENKKKYQVIEPDDLYTNNVDSNVLRNKIVLLGYVNLDPNNIEDKKFTPMNHKFYGKQHPDMNGIIVQANIISMVLDANYINKMPKWLAWAVAIVIGWIHMSLFIRYYLDSHIWFHLVAKVAQVLSVIFFAYLGMFIFDKFAIKLEMKYTLYVIALAVDVIYFYEAFVGWLHRKFNYQTIFSHHHHPLEHETHHKSEHHRNEDHNEHHKQGHATHEQH
jgi:CHASE2 domain-containing sensor protein